MKDVQTKRPPRVVSLPAISEYLYLANIVFARESPDILQNMGIAHIINVSNHDVHTCIPITNITFIDLPDTNYSYLISIVNKIVQKIKWCIDNKYRVLINCTAGSNRSVTAIISYALQYCTPKETAHYWIHYIKQRKLQQGYSDWNTLVNKHLVNFIFTLEYNLDH